MAAKSLFKLLMSPSDPMRIFLNIPRQLQSSVLVRGALVLNSLLFLLNLLGDATKAFYITWATGLKAQLREASKYCEIDVFNGKRQSMVKPLQFQLKIGKIDPEAGVCSLLPEWNHRWYWRSVSYHKQTSLLLLICHLTSCLVRSMCLNMVLSMLVRRRTLGPAGICIAIVRDDLPDLCKRRIAAILTTKYLLKTSMFNTPPTYAWYLSGLVFKWLKAQGALKRWSVNQEKVGTTTKQRDWWFWFLQERSARSKPFKNERTIPTCETWSDAKFLERLTLVLSRRKGHRAVGGMSIAYNAMSLVEGVQALVSLAKDFLKRNTFWINDRLVNDTAPICFLLCRLYFNEMNAAFAAFFCSEMCKAGMICQKVIKEGEQIALMFLGRKINRKRHFFCLFMNVCYITSRSNV